MNRMQKVIVLVETSSITSKNSSIIKKALHLVDSTLKSYKNYEVRTTLHIIAYNNEAHFVSRNCIDSICFGGKANLSSALTKLKEIFSANSLYTYPPIVLLFSSGKADNEYKKVINKLRLFNAFQFSLKLGVVFKKYPQKEVQPIIDFAEKNVINGNNVKGLSSALIDRLPKLIKTQNKNKKFYYAS